MSDPIETRSVERRPRRSLFIALGVVVLLAVGLGRCSEATSQLPPKAVGPIRPPVELDMETVPLQLATGTSLPPTTPTSTCPRCRHAHRPDAPIPRSRRPRGPRTWPSSLVENAGATCERSRSGRTPHRPRSSSCSTMDPATPARSSIGLAGARSGKLQHLIVAAPRWTRPDDAQFAADAIVDIGLVTCVDLARVDLAGFSTGAMLGARVVCEHPGLVTAFVAVAGLLAPDRCPPDDRVPVLARQGALDETVSPSSVADAAKAWARQDRCHPEPVSETVGWNIAYYEFERCEDAVEVQVYVLSDVGHEWPERVDDLSDARRWADLMSTTTIATAFCETYAR